MLMAFLVIPLPFLPFIIAYSFFVYLSWPHIILIALDLSGPILLAFVIMMFLFIYMFVRVRIHFAEEGITLTWPRVPRSSSFVARESLKDATAKGGMIRTQKGVKGLLTVFLVKDPETARFWIDKYRASRPEPS